MDTKLIRSELSSSRATTIGVPIHPSGNDVSILRPRMELNTESEPLTEQEFFNALGIDCIDVVEAQIVESLPTRELPVTHRFTPGLYIREIFMPAGTLLTSKIHKTEHPYVVSKGVVSVWTERDGAVLITAPHTGITKPGTRRVLFIHEDTVWTTFHATDKTDPNEIEDEIIMKHTNRLLEGMQPQPMLQ